MIYVEISETGHKLPVEAPDELADELGAAPGSAAYRADPAGSAQPGGCASIRASAGFVVVLVPSATGPV